MRVDYNSESTRTKIGGFVGQVTISPPLTIPPEVEVFAAHEGVAPYLHEVIMMTSRVFPNCRINLLVEDDPEIADDRHIVLEVKTNMKVAAALEAHFEWSHQLFSVCPAPLVCVFRLGLEIEP
jgi:hypothetical protein